MRNSKSFGLGSKDVLFFQAVKISILHVDDVFRCRMMQNKTGVRNQLFFLRPNPAGRKSPFLPLSG